MLFTYRVYFDWCIQGAASPHPKKIKNWNKSDNNLWNVNARILKATIENKTTSVTTYFNKSTTGKNVFIVSVIVTLK